MDILNRLRQLDHLRETSVEGKPCYIHDDHRWVLPLLFQAQEAGLLPRPCTLVGFDAHHDCFVPNALDEIRSVVEAGLTAEGLLDLCSTQLLKIDSDWVIAGMELGLIKDAVIFGVVHDLDKVAERLYTDSTGAQHRLWALECLPGDMFGYQGSLSDLARRYELQPLWDALEWEVVPRQGFQFRHPGTLICLDLDLDLFTARCRGTAFTWPEVVYKAEFEVVSDYSATEGWSGKRFFDALRNRAGIITIAREPFFCGGEEVCNQNLALVSHRLFDVSGVL